MIHFSSLDIVLIAFFTQYTVFPGSRVSSLISPSISLSNSSGPSRLNGIQAAAIFLLRISSDPVNRIVPIPNPIHGVCVKPIIRYPTAHTTATSVA